MIECSEFSTNWLQRSPLHGQWLMRQLHFVPWQNNQKKHHNTEPDIFTNQMP
jgi:hypothetical protein